MNIQVVKFLINATVRYAVFKDDLYQQSVKLFLKVNLSLLRRNFLHALHVKKKTTKALSQKVMWKKMPMKKLFKAEA